jgi:hypothetical protein
MNTLPFSASGNAILLPFFAMMLLTMAVWFFMYARRIPFIQNNRLTPEQLRPLEFARISPPAVANPSDNLRNLFEIPTLFYALVIYLLVSNRVDDLHVATAWVFVAFRILHSAVHCTVNIVLLRFWLYCLSTLALWVMLIRAALPVIAAAI